MNRLQKPLLRRDNGIGVVTLHTAKIRHYAVISLANKSRYSDQHDYDLIACEQELDATRPAAWNKIGLIQQHLPRYQWVFWSDADSLIMNPAIRLEQFIDPEFELIAACDSTGLNSGQFLIRNTAASMAFLEQVYEQTQFIDHPLWEQAAIQHLFRTRQARIRLKIVPQRWFNSFEHSYRPGDFLIHFAGSRDKLGGIQRFSRLLEEAAARSERPAIAAAADHALRSRWPCHSARAVLVAR